MPNGKTDFHSVPFESINGPERNEARSRHVSCVICGSPVSLEGCKLDEHGDPVHDQCYVDRVSRPKHSDTSKPKSQN